MSLELVVIAAVLVVVVVTALAPKVGIAAPLLLVVLGFAVSVLPFVDVVVVPPEWILGGVLPPLLYSAAVNTPAMDFRRDFRLISAFSVVLVVFSAVVIGVVMCWLIPGLPLAIGIGVGAIISPTDAVATTIVRKAGVSPRIVTVLEGESMLNDATALVLLRSAIAAATVTVSLWQVAAQFVYAAAVAVAVGYAVGKLNLLVRSRIRQVTPNVALSLVLPFLAYLPAENLGGSGLVAAVTAGLITGHGAPRRLGAEDRLTERAVWRTVELLLESAVFLLVGLELPTLAADVLAQGGSLTTAVLLAVVAATVAIAIRAAFVSFSVWSLARRNRRVPQVRERLTELQQHLDGGELPQLGRPSDPNARPSSLPPRRVVKEMRRQSEAEGGVTPEQLGRWQQLVTRRLADVDYLAAEQFGWREGVILVAAGMRGAVTIAAAQSLPAGTVQRSLLILLATMVAFGTLLVQGGTLRWLAVRLGLTGGTADTDPKLWADLHAAMASAALKRLDAGTLSAGYPSDLIERARGRLEQLHGGSDENSDFGGGANPEVRKLGARYIELRLEMIAAQREELLDLRDLGSYPSALLDAALAQLDAEQIGIELRRQP